MVQHEHRCARAGDLWGYRPDGTWADCFACRPAGEELSIAVKPAMVPLLLSTAVCCLSLQGPADEDCCGHTFYNAYVFNKWLSDGGPSVALACCPVGLIGNGVLTVSFWLEAMYRTACCFCGAFPYLAEVDTEDYLHRVGHNRKIESRMRSPKMFGLHVRNVVERNGAAWFEFSSLFKARGHRAPAESPEREHHNPAAGDACDLPPTVPSNTFTALLKKPDQPGPIKFEGTQGSAGLAQPSDVWFELVRHFGPLHIFVELFDFGEHAADHTLPLHARAVAYDPVYHDAVHRLLGGTVTTPRHSDADATAAQLAKLLGNANGNAAADKPTVTVRVDEAIFSEDDGPRCRIMTYHPTVTGSYSADDLWKALHVLPMTSAYAKHKMNRTSLLRPASSSYAHNPLFGQ